MGVDVHIHGVVAHLGYRETVPASTANWPSISGGSERARHALHVGHSPAEHVLRDVEPEAVPRFEHPAPAGIAGGRRGEGAAVERLRFVRPGCFGIGYGRVFGDVLRGVLVEQVVPGEKSPSTRAVISPCRMAR